MAVTQSTVNLKDDDLDKLVSSGAIVDYTFTEDSAGWRGVESQTLEITFPGGQKLLVWSWSTPAPESSGLSVEAIIPEKQCISQ